MPGLSIPTVRLFDARTKQIYSAGQDKKSNIDMQLLRTSVQRLRSSQLGEKERIRTEKPDKKTVKPKIRKKTPTAPPKGIKPLPGVQYHTVLTGIEPVETVASLFEEKVYIKRLIHGG